MSGERFFIRGKSIPNLYQVLENHLSSIRKCCSEHGGDLNEAVNAYFSTGDRNIVGATPVTASQDDFMDIDAPLQTAPSEPPLPLLPSSRIIINPFSLLDPNYNKSFFGGSSNNMAGVPHATHPRQVREIPIEVKDSSRPSGQGLTIEDVTETDQTRESDVRGPIIIDDEVDENILGAQTVQNGLLSDRSVRPSAPIFDTLPEYSNDIEEEMIRAAIEASRRDVEEIIDPMPEQRQSNLEDPDLAHAVSLSLKTAEQENALREHGLKVGASKPADSELKEIGGLNGRFEAGTSSFQDEADDIEEQPLVRHRSRRVSSGSVEPIEDVDGIDTGPLLPGTHNIGSHPRDSEHAFTSEEWGGMSSVEHDEAVMLEAAMFGGIPESGYQFAYTPHQFIRPDGPYPHQTPRPPSPSLTAQRLIREQQDDEYLASLQADREKEMKVIEEAEARRLEEEAASRAALEEERLKLEETQRKMAEEQELERQLTAKEASLPQEPDSDDENAVTLLVRMSDGSRHGRRFLKSNKLQSLFDFIDVGRGVKPGTYRVVRPYPRRAFGVEESSLSLNELGLTSKQEALFLELI